eukprot:TRINITY_DN4282_c0_g1_i1.p1 TRINITY_DN4282_c0_g1~~TRINITY_DN4282_c0_g1_i1.p1  ORF type:complete len:563 (-),score=46.58 TRINITY_DN4282_c0_g1_i1:7-1695(-)
MSEQWNQYENSATGIALEYPPAWSYEEDLSIGGVIFAHESTISGQETNPFAPVVNILANRLPETSLDDYTQQQIIRLRQMAVGSPSDLKVDRSASLAGYPAHRAICTLHVDPTRAIRLYSVWTKVNDWIYLVHFTCDIFEFSRHQRVVLRILNSVKLVVPSPKTVLFSAFHDEQLCFSMKFPSSFEQIFPAIIKKKGSGNVSPASPRIPRSQPLVFVKDRFQGPNKEDFRRFISLVSHKRRHRPDASDEVVSQEIEAIVGHLKAMMVAKVELSWIDARSSRCRVLEYSSDAVLQGSWYRQVILVRQEPAPPLAPSETGETIEQPSSSDAILPESSLATADGTESITVPSRDEPSSSQPEIDYTIFILSMQSNSPKTDEYTSTLFSLTEQSLLPYPTDFLARWHQWEHLILGFGLFFDPSLYVCKDAGMPFAEALFVHKDDIVGSDVPDDSTTFSIVVRQVPTDATVNLTSIGEDIIENLGQLYTLEVLKTENSSLNGRDCRVIISRGINNTTGEQQQMYFAHKLVVNQESGVAVWFAFAAPPARWQQEWHNVESYISTLYWK